MTVSYDCVCTSQRENPIGSVGERASSRTSRFIPNQWASSLRLDLRAALSAQQNNQRHADRHREEASKPIAAPAVPTVKPTRQQHLSLEERLLRLERMRTKRLIAQREYEGERAEMLKELE